MILVGVELDRVELVCVDALLLVGVELDWEVLGLIDTELLLD